MNSQVFKLVSRTNETRYVTWHETCACKRRLDASVCNDKQRGIVINAGLNVKNWLVRVSVMDLFGIFVHLNMNVINHVMVVNIWIIWIVSVKADW